MVCRSPHSQVSEPAVYPHFTRFALHPTDSCAQPVKSLQSGPSSMSATRETLCRWNLEVRCVFNVLVINANIHVNENLLS